jgi:hypothetical protein
MADSTLDLLNRVLRGLRRDVIAAGTDNITDPYHLYLLDLINVAKEEVEEAYDWQELQDLVVVTATGANDQNLPMVTVATDASGMADTDVPNNSRIQYFQYSTEYDMTGTHERKPMVVDITDTHEYLLKEISTSEMLYKRATDNDETRDPEYFSIDRDPSTGYLVLQVWPKPEDLRVYRLSMVIPQVELPSSTLTTTEIKVPSRPVWLRALFYANQERGEELGRPGSELDRQAQDALDNAIIRSEPEKRLTSFPQ